MSGWIVAVTYAVMALAIVLVIVADRRAKKSGCYERDGS